MQIQGCYRAKYYNRKGDEIASEPWQKNRITEDSGKMIAALLYDMLSSRDLGTKWPHGMRLGLLVEQVDPQTPQSSDEQTFREEFRTAQSLPNSFNPATQGLYYHKEPVSDAQFTRIEQNNKIVFYFAFPAEMAAPDFSFSYFALYLTRQNSPDSDKRIYLLDFVNKKYIKYNGQKLVLEIEITFPGEE